MERTPLLPQGMELQGITPRSSIVTQARLVVKEDIKCYSKNRTSALKSNSQASQDQEQLT